MSTIWLTALNKLDSDVPYVLRRKLAQIVFLAWNHVEQAISLVSPLESLFLLGYADLIC